MKRPDILQIDASGWRTESDFYDAILTVLGSPPWHGRNMDALSDSLIAGQINAVEPPFHIEISGLERRDKSLENLVQDLKNIANESTSNGRTVIITSK